MPSLILQGLSCFTCLHLTTIPLRILAAPTCAFLRGASVVTIIAILARRYEHHPLSSQAPFGSLELSRDNEKSLKESFSKSDKASSDQDKEQAQQRTGDSDGNQWFGEKETRFSIDITPMANYLRQS